LRDKKGDGAPKALAALIKSAPNTKVAERAQLIAKALETPLP